MAENYTEYGYRGLEEIKLLKKQLAEETKEKYTLYKRIKELNEELSFIKNKSKEMSTESGPEYIQKHRT
tara:strand:- start:79 stop:285 length:207 start_codon:yes stop_codon:yes gene_type:complete